MNPSRLPFLWCLCLFAVARAVAAVELRGEPHVYKRIGDVELRVFIFKPADWKITDRRPAMVFFHGGGWTGGNANQFAPHAEYLASRGLVAVTVHYRLLKHGDEHGSELPLVCVQDARSALRWVRTHAAELGIDPARLGAGGGSAGGYLAAQTALVPGGDDPADNLAIALTPAALVLFNPVIGGRPAEAADVSFERRLGARLTEYLESSPANHVTAAAPPTIIFHGTEDTTIPPVQVKRFQQSMERAGVRCEVVFYAGQKHSFFNRDQSGGRYFRETMIAADHFLASLGWLQGEPAYAHLPGER